MKYDENELIERAKIALATAYAPYSKIQVGAALQDKSGRIFTGCNIENASYGLTICAERVAIGCAVQSGSREYIAMAIANSTDRIFTPCGACRQVLYEFVENIDIIMISAKGEIKRTDLKTLYPDSFNLRSE